MSVFVLANRHLKVLLDSKGAELKSIRAIPSGTEYLWTGEPEYWARNAPVLFPIVGRLKDNEYFLNDHAYHLSQHGFARDKEFKLLNQTSAGIDLILTSDPETLLQYPFNFNLIISYRITDKEVITGYNVQNTGMDHMYFSIGGHPGFRCPVNERERFEDYRLVFNNDVFLERYLLNDGLLIDKTEKILLDEGMLLLDYALFEKEAIVLKNLQSNEIKLIDKDGLGMAFRFDNYPFFGIWTAKRNAPFICLEPWHGIADSVSHSKQLEGKEGIIKLKPNESFKCSYTVEIIEP